MCATVLLPDGAAQLCALRLWLSSARLCLPRHGGVGRGFWRHPGAVGSALLPGTLPSCRPWVLERENSQLQRARAACGTSVTARRGRRHGLGLLHGCCCGGEVTYQTFCLLPLLWPRLICGDHELSVAGRVDAGLHGSVSRATRQCDPLLAWAVHPRRDAVTSAN